MLFNYFPRGIFLVPAFSGRQAEAKCCGTTPSEFFCAFVSEDTHDA